MATGRARQRRKRAGVPFERHERMSPVDTAWLRMDGAASRMMIVSVMTTSTPVRADDLRDVVRTRLLCFPRFRHRPVADALGASWHEAVDFDLDDHFVPVALPDPAGQAELEQLTAELAGERLDPSRPLWQIHFVERYGAGSAWVMRLHHCYADGVAMIRVLLSLTEQDSGPALAGAHEAAMHARDRRGPLPLLGWLDRLAQPASDILEAALAEGARLLEGGIHQVFHPDNVANLAAQAGSMAGEFAKVLALPDDPVTPLRGLPLTGVKRVAWSEPLDLQEVRTVGRALGCTVNDVLMASLAGALGGWLREERGVDTRGLVLRASVPVNLRAAEEPMTLGNRFGLVFVDLPVGTSNPLHRVYSMHDAMGAVKGSLQPAMTLAVLGTLGLAPAVVQGPAIDLFSRKGSLVASNVPGPQAPLHLCGQRIDGMYFWVPQSGTIGVGASLLSYAGKVYFGLIADRACVPEPRQVVTRLPVEFERLVLATTVGALGLREARQAPKPRKPRAKPARRTGSGKRSRPRRQTAPPAASSGPVD